MSRMRVKSEDGDEPFIRDTTTVSILEVVCGATSVISAAVDFVDFEHFIQECYFRGHGAVMVVVD